MQDGARPHRTEPVFSFLYEYFGETVIALDYLKCPDPGMDWPPYSPGFTPCDYFLWGVFKDIAHRNNPTNLDELEQSICETNESISVQTLQDVMANFVALLHHLSSVSGDHFEHVVM